MTQMMAQPSAQQNVACLDWLRGQVWAKDGLALATKHRPVLCLDRAEPYAPLAFGVTLLEKKQHSPSSKFKIEPKGAITIEYAIWYDWDIQHLYDLEHIWVHLDADGDVMAVEASSHGGRQSMPIGNDNLSASGHRPVLFVEPGKHAHWASAEKMKHSGSVDISAVCNAFAGEGGVHTSNIFGDSGQISVTGFDHRLARLKMKRDAFSPTFEFIENELSHPEPALVSWEVLEQWIPLRVASLVEHLPTSVPHLAAIFLDCGDTLVDESTEEKQADTEIVLRAELIPGADEMMEKLVRDGFRLALVADGPRETFVNVLAQHNLWDHFEVHIISGDIGALKPSSKMFAAAFQALHLGAAERSRTVMVGNNLQRDILGANEFGLISVFLAWSKRRTHSPATPDEKPHLTIDYISELYHLLEKIELSLPLDAVAQNGSD